MSLGILTRGFATTVVHTFTVETLHVTCCSHDLFHQSMNIVVIVLIVILLGYIDGVLLGVIMSNTRCVETNINEVVPHLQNEVIDRNLS